MFPCLKSVVGQSKKILLLNKANFSSNVIKNVKLDTVNMSFASYESTLTQSREGPAPLIIMHGLFGSKANWNSLCKGFLKNLSPLRKVLSVDARNHGDSPHSLCHTYYHIAEDIQTFMEQLKIKKAVLLGHSMGGRGMMYFALKYPALVDKLIVADISPISTSPNFKSVIKLIIAMHKVALPKNVPMSTARLAADMQLSTSINDKGLRAFLLTNMIQKSDGSYAWRINIPAILANLSDHILSFPQINNLQFMGPVLFVSGGKSDFIQKSDHSQILKMFPNAEFKEVDGAGHWLHSEKPKEFTQFCIEFLNRKTTAV